MGRAGRGRTLAARSEALPDHVLLTTTKDNAGSSSPLLPRLQSWVAAKQRGAAAAEERPSRKGCGSTLASCHHLVVAPGHIEAALELTDEVLGNGGVCGGVRLAKCRSTGREVAVKTLRLADLKESQRARITNEVDIHSSVDHPHIVRLERVYEERGPKAPTVQLVMERLKGGELFDRVQQRKQFSEEQAAQAVTQVLLAVAYLHAHGVVHRDIKLENLIYESSESEVLKLIDFGAASRLDDPTQLRELVGTLQYCAPEVFGKVGSSKADLWSVGVVTCMLLTGKPLYYGSQEEILENVMAGRPKFVKAFANLSADAQQFVQALLTVDPERRPSAADALDHPWLRHHASTPAIDITVLTSLRAFTRSGPGLSRACRLLLARCKTWATDTDEMVLRCHFQALQAAEGRGSQSRGTVGLEDIRRALKQLGGDEDEAEELFVALDCDADGEVSYIEFLAAMLPESSLDREEAALELFYCLVAGGAFTAEAALEQLRASLASIHGHNCFMSLSELRHDLHARNELEDEAWRVHKGPNCGAGGALERLYNCWKMLKPAGEWTI